MPLPERYEPILKDFFAGKITGKEMARIIEEMDNRQMSLNFEGCPALQRRTSAVSYAAEYREDGAWGRGSEPSP